MLLGLKVENVQEFEAILTLRRPQWRQTLCTISLAAVMSMKPTASCLAHPVLGLGAKLAHESRKGLTVETCDLMSLAGRLLFQSAALWREISPLIVSSIESYFYYVHFIWDNRAVVTDAEWNFKKMWYNWMRSDDFHVSFREICKYYRSKWKFMKKCKLNETFCFIRHLKNILLHFESLTQKLFHLSGPNVNHHSLLLLRLWRIWLSKFNGSAGVFLFFFPSACLQ